eukprot:CAMPEP_0185777518 /NCGR_PEP_ID=MMETSP1174-20130828/89761_1 /TAXON_ID=35687 /ORGANISM="Dictyocha speculum, Strain CCMP1381" /LENGTH=76 /DNA_ID=CAMNT_0028465913 /DNA_START=1307 /DNA_END=1537 /DNA_ORIENTATION=+
MVLVVRDFFNLLISALKNALDSILVELPLLNVLRHVLCVRAKNIVDVNGYKVAGEVHHGDIEVDAELGIRIRVQYD